MISKTITATAALSLIIKSSVLKTAFGYSFALPILAIMEQEIGQGDFFQNILEAVPSKIVLVLGVVYGVALVMKQVSDTWTSHQINRINVKKEREHLEQEEIHTEQERQELNKEK